MKGGRKRLVEDGKEVREGEVEGEKRERREVDIKEERKGGRGHRRTQGRAAKHT